MAGKLTRTEEVFLILRELNLNSGLTFSWQDWIDAWDACYGEAAFSWQRKDRRKKHLHMSAGRALRRQVRFGTVEKLKRGAYMFNHMRPERPFFGSRSN